MHQSFLLAFLFCIIVSGCTIKDKKETSPIQYSSPYQTFNQQIDSSVLYLKDGDLLLRSGTDMTSQLIKNFCKKDKSYSHSGLVFFTNGTPKVYHILAGDENPDSRLKPDSLETFCNPRHNSGFAIYRYDLDSSEVASLKRTIIKWYDKQIKFDSLFNLSSDDRMYCSEMIAKGIEKSTGNRIKIPTTKLSENEIRIVKLRLPYTTEYFRTLEVIPIDNLYTNKDCALVKKFNFTYSR